MVPWHVSGKYPVPGRAGQKHGSRYSLSYPQKYLFSCCPPILKICMKKGRVKKREFFMRPFTYGYNSKEYTGRNGFCKK